MLKMPRIMTMLILASTLAALPAFSEGIDGEPTVDVDARQLLIDTAALDDPRDLEAARTARDDAQQALDDAIGAGADQTDIDALTSARDAAQSEVEREQAESMAVADAVAALSDRQVQDLDRALNDTRHNGRIIDLDAATLQDIADRDLGHREIQALTKGLEEEAKFENLAARFENKYEETGREAFLRNQERALDKAERQREKFENKVDRFEAARDEIRSTVRSEARAEAKQQARANARSDVKRAAREAAREEAKQAAKARGRGLN